MPRLLKRNTKSPRVYVTLRDPETSTNRCFTIADATIDQVEQMIDLALQGTTNPPEGISDSETVTGPCEQPGHATSDGPDYIDNACPTAGGDLHAPGPTTTASSKRVPRKSRTQKSKPRTQTPARQSA